MNKLYHLLRADFLERVRRDSFLLIIGLTIFLGYNTLSGFLRLELGSYRGVYNADWIGMVTALILTFFLSLFGFYLVRGGVERDRQTGTGQIIAATPTSNLTYALGKFGSNLMVLWVVTAVMFIAAVVMLLTKGTPPTLDLWALVSPFLFLTTPITALIAAIAVLFETTPFLRSGLGNVLYFLLWGGFLPLGGAKLLGMALIEEQIVAPLTQIDPTYSGSFALGAAPRGVLQTFVWEGFSWSNEIILERLMWVGIAFVIAAVAALPFDRFDSARRTLMKPRTKRTPRLTRLTQKLTLSNGPLAVLSKITPRSQFLQLLVAEFKLLVKGQNVWWTIVAISLIIACLLSPLEVVRRWLLPVAWIWPILLWSQMGAREKLHNTSQIIFSAPHAAVRQLGAMWLAGVILAMLMGIGAALSLLLGGDLLGLFFWIVGALFIPALALTVGVWSGHNRVFEIVYLSLWYAGPMNGVTAVDFTGATFTDPTLTQPLTLLAITIVLLGLALMGRKRELK